MDWQTPLSTDVSFLNGYHDVETLANTITDVDIPYFHNLSYEDSIDPSKSTRLRAMHARSNTLVIAANVCSPVDEDSVKCVHEVAKVYVFIYARTKQWADLLIASVHLGKLLFRGSFGYCRSRHS